MPTQNEVKKSSTRYPHLEAGRIASELTSGELDGWNYRREAVTMKHSVVAVYDETNEFVSCWNSYKPNGDLIMVCKNSEKGRRA